MYIVDRGQTAQSYGAWAIGTVIAKELLLPSMGTAADKGAGLGQSAGPPMGVLKSVLDTSLVQS